MKKTLLITLLTFAVTSVSAEEKWFGAGVKPDPTLTIPFVGVKAPLPTACIGKDVSASFDFKCDKKSISFRLPYFKFEWDFPGLSLGRGEKKITLGNK